MANSFAKRAQERRNGSPIITGHEKAQTEDIIAKYGQITITDFDLINGRNGEYAVFNFAEDENAYFNGGSVLSDIFAGFVDDYDNDIAVCREAFKAEGGLTVKLFYDRTKSGNRFVNVEIIDK